MKLDFYYWSYQCPLNDTMLNLLKEYEDKLEIRRFDIAHDFALAQRQRMFFPTLTVVEEQHRFFRPLDRPFLDALVSGILPQERPYRPALSAQPQTGSVVALTAANYAVAAACTGRPCAAICAQKTAFLHQLGLTTYGFLNLAPDGSLLGGAEYLPSQLVPYPIPRADAAAFITCVYPSSERYDGKSAALRALENWLSSRSQQVMVISDENGVFPNGDLAFFLRQGYEDQGVIAQEGEYAKLHLLTKSLPERELQSALGQGAGCDG